MSSFWNNKRVLITGHTGFKGSWLCLWLHKLGANVVGYALEPPTEPSMFETLYLDNVIDSVIGDIRDSKRFTDILEEYKPEVIFHLAAQALVRASYTNPVLTLETNIIGTANVLECARQCKSVKVIINVTTDKCYENREWAWGYRENDTLGGYDPYSCSKACSELVTNSYRKSFLNSNGILLASARAGNVIGGGDWAEDRLVPDIVRAFINNNYPSIRNPHAIRPWQHVLEPLRGYMLLAEKMWNEGEQFAQAWNFGPNDNNIVSVREVTETFAKKWGMQENSPYSINDGEQPHEAQILKLDCSKSKSKLGWMPILDIDKTLDWTCQWYKAYNNSDNMIKLTLEQIDCYQKIMEEQHE